MNPGPTFPPRRLLVALDASAPSLTALEAALALARRFGAAVEALFVEDPLWRAVAGHPAARHVDASSGAARTAGALEMAEAVAALLSQARRRCEALAARAQVTTTFRTAQGSVDAALLGASAEADVVCLGRTGWGRSGPAALGRTARALLARSDAWVFLLRAGEALERPVGAWVPADRPAAGVLQAALALAADDGGQLLVLLAGGTQAERDRRRAEVSALCAARGVAPRFRAVPSGAGEGLAEALTGLAVRTLVVPADVLTAGAGPAACLARVACPVLAVR